MMEATRGDQFAEAFRKARAASHRQQRNRRGGRMRGLGTVTGPGMVRLPASERPATRRSPGQVAAGMSDLPRDGQQDLLGLR